MSRAKGRGRRYNNERKLNIKKVIAVIIAILVVIMFVITINQLLNQSSKTNEKAFSLAYYTIYEDGKWGVIDTKGNTIIQPTYEEMIIIPDNTKPVFICTENVNYEDGTYNSKVIKIFLSLATSISVSIRCIFNLFNSVLYAIILY